MALSFLERMQLAWLALTQDGKSVCNEPFDFTRVFPDLDIQEATPGGYWFVTHPQILTHGQGNTAAKAVCDFQSKVVDLFQELVASEAILAPQLQRQLNYLRMVLAEQHR